MYNNLFNFSSFFILNHFKYLQTTYLKSEVNDKSIIKNVIKRTIEPEIRLCTKENAKNKVTSHFPLQLIPHENLEENGVEFPDGKTSNNALTRPRRKLTIAWTRSLIGVNEFLKACVSESWWKENRKGERKSADRGGKNIYTLSMISRIHRLSPRPWTVVRFYDRFSCTAAWLTQSGKRERRCEAGIRIPPKTVPLSFQRLEEYVATSSFLPPPSSFPRERNLWKGWRRRRSESTNAIHVVVVRFARNDNAWMALIRRIENRVWLYGVWRRKGRVSMVMEVD